MTDLKPGRDLDALIAEKVMGWTPNYPGGWPHPPKNIPNRKKYIDSHDGTTVIPAYSTSIEAAWEVVDKLGGNMFQLHYDTRYGTEGVKGWSVILDGSVMCQFVDTAPHAICLAALKAVEGR